MVASSAVSSGQGRPVNRTFRWLVGFGGSGVLLIVGATLVFYWPSIAWMAEEWASGNSLFSHGYLIASIAVFLVVRSALQLPLRRETSMSWLGVLAVLATSFVWLLGWLANVVVVHTLVVPFLALAAIYAAFGLQSARHMAFSVLFICFALPAWQYLQPPFRDLAIVLIDVTVRAIGIPVQVTGTIVHLPEGSFRIINGCSGINFIVVGLALSTLYGHLYYKLLRPRVLLVVTAVVLAMLTNWVRVVSLALIGNASQMQSELVYDHSNYGWLLFAVSLVPLFIIARRLEPADERMSTEKVAKPDNASDRSRPVTVIIVLLALGVGPAWGMFATDNYDASTIANIQLPMGEDDWAGPFDDPIIWSPKFIGASGESLGRYDSNNATIWLYRNIYLTQEQDRELIHLHNDVTGRLRVSSEEQLLVVADRQASITVKSYRASNGAADWLIWSWYTLNGSTESSDTAAKAKQSLASLFGSPEAGITAIAVLCGDSCDDAAEALKRFVSSGIPLKSLDYYVESLEK